MVWLGFVSVSFSAQCSVRFSSFSVLFLKVGFVYLVCFISIGFRFGSVSFGSIHFVSARFRLVRLFRFGTVSFQIVSVGYNWDQMVRFGSVRYARPHRSERPLASHRCVKPLHRTPEYLFHPYLFVSPCRSVSRVILRRLLTAVPTL